MSPEGVLQGPSLGFISTREDPDSSHEPGTRSKTCSRGAYAKGMTPLLKTLTDAEAAAKSAAIQLVSFKDAMEAEFSESRRSAVDKQRIARQRGLLLEKLEEFRRINKSLRQKIKQLQDAEADRIDADNQIDSLLKRIARAEKDNAHFKSELTEAERRVEELVNLQQLEQENMKSVVHMSKAVDATRAHLQGQLLKKETENNHLTLQLRTLERTLTEQKMEIDELRGSIASLPEKTAQDIEQLRKAARAQKLRAERFEAAIEKCYAQLKEKDVQLANARSEIDSRRKQKEDVTDEKDKLVAHVELLKSQIADLTVRLQREKNEVTTATETVMQRVENLIAENGELCISNATLKAAVARVEQQLTDCDAALVEEKILSQDRKHQAEQCQYQVAECKAEVDNLRIKYAKLLRDIQNTQDGKGEKIDKVRQELQGRVEQLQAFPELLRAVEQNLLECQEKLRRSDRKCSEKSESIRQLQVKMESQTKLVTSSVEMRASIQEANLNLHEKTKSLEKEMDRLHLENQDLVQRLAAQEDALGYSNRQLDQRSLECQALSRQLESALSDVRHQVTKVKGQAVSREEALQTKILELEAEKCKRDKELKLLRQSKLTAEKKFEVRLKDLQLSLDQSESHKQSIQNYIDFLKNSYTTMFDEGLQASSFGPSYFLK
ncbi:outer dense fiber protein 2-like [Aulostomus maculatus]